MDKIEKVINQLLAESKYPEPHEVSLININEPKELQILVYSKNDTAKIKRCGNSKFVYKNKKEIPKNIRSKIENIIEKDIGVKNIEYDLVITFSEKVRNNINKIIR